MSKRRAPQLPKQADPDPARVRRLVGEGARLLAARRSGDAIVKLAEAWELDSQNVAVAINLGGAYILQGKHDRAIPALEAAALLEPENAMVWSNLAAAYLGKLPLATPERQQKAIDAYERALALDARAPHVHYNLGLIYLERDEPLRAAAHFRGALEIDPSDRDARYWLDKIEEGAQIARPPAEDSRAISATIEVLESG
jgi:tetratricopeptide (TPR) repeat protein